MKTDDKKAFNLADITANIGSNKNLSEEFEQPSPRNNNSKRKGSNI